MHEEEPVKHDGQQEVGGRARRHDEGAPTDGLPVEGTRQVGGSNFALAFVQHLDVAAQGKRRDRPLGAVASVAAHPEHLAETEGKTQNLDVAVTRRQVVAHFMHHYQHRESDQEGREIPGQHLRIHCAGSPHRARSSVAIVRP
jgi:hypothetical protein